MISLQSAKLLLKYAAIRTGLEVCSLAGLQSVFSSAGGRGLIFTLHHVRPEQAPSGFAPNAILSVTPEFLEQAITVARACALTPVRLHDLPALLADPSDTRKFVAFTLDDGYRDNAEFAAPVFRSFDVPYTIFINPGFVERTRTMWWETIAELTRRATAFEFDFGQGTVLVRTETPGQKSSAFERLAAFVQTIDEDEAVQRIDHAATGCHAIDPIDPMAIVDGLVMDEGELRDLAKDPLVDFGAHTVTHVNLRRVSAARLHAEIHDSTDAVARYAGRRPRSFSYPYGWSSAVSDREVRAAAAAGFAVAVGTRPGVLGPASLARPTDLPRVSLNGLFQKKRYVRALISGLPFTLM